LRRSAVLLLLLLLAGLTAAPGAHAAGARCGHAAEGFAYSIRAGGESCRQARALVDAWFDAQYRCGVSNEGAPRRRSCRIRAHHCTARRLYGMVATVHCRGRGGRNVAFRYSP
jgi:hypothetical protein